MSLHTPEQGIFNAPSSIDIVSVLPPITVLNRGPEAIGKLALSPEAAQAAELAVQLGAEHNIGMHVAARLVEKALQGEEASHERVNGTFIGDHSRSSSRGSLDRFFYDAGYNKAWSVIDRVGQPLTGTNAEQLRDASGTIVNKKFIDELTTRGIAVENSQRNDYVRGNRIPVTNRWCLVQSANGAFLPVAKVLTVDADARTEARRSNARPIEISERLVVFPGLELPTSGK